MASKGNRVLKQKTLKAKKMDLEAGRSSKYVSKNTPAGDTTAKLPSKSEVNEAYKNRAEIKARTGVDFDKETKASYMSEINENNENRVRKSKTPGSVTIRTGGNTRADKLTTKELKKAGKTKAGKELLSRDRKSTR